MAGTKFRVLEGIVKVDGVMHKKGALIDTDIPLDKMFANKVKRLGGKTKFSRDHDDLPDSGGGTKVMDGPNAQVKKSLKAEKKGPGPGQTEEEFTDMSAESKMRGKAKDGKSAKKKGGTKRKFAEGYPEEVEGDENEELDDMIEEEDEDSEEETETEEEDDASGEESESEESEEESDFVEESDEEEEEKAAPVPKKKVKKEEKTAKMPKKKK